MIRLSVVEARAESLGTGPATRRIGRYALFGEIASGGMATVYFGRLVGAVGFSRSVAIKQLHPQYAKSPEFVAQFLDEAQLTARIRHPNVVSVLDVVAREGELFVIMEFVEGEPLSRLVRFAREPVPLSIASAILVQVLLGLHAAHEATTEEGVPLQIVHRDVSPQNMLVGIDGSSHILDFGVAKAASRVHTTENGQIKGKLTYMAPEQLRGADLDRRVDVFAAGIVLWELITGQRLFARGDPGATVTAVLSGFVKPPSTHREEVSAALDGLVLKALAPNREDRFASAREMAIALEACIPPASSLKVGAWVESVAGDSLKERAQRLREAEESTGVNAVVDAAGLQRRLASVSQHPHRSGSASIPTIGSPIIERAQRVNWLQRESVRPWLLRGAAALLGAAVLWLSLLAFRPAGAPPTPRPLASAAAPLPEAASVGATTAEPKAVLATDLPTEPVSGKAQASGEVPRTVRKIGKSGPGVANCKPPYVLDGQGRKRFKPECF
ncbi:MAG TPA: protein kinase [Polyangiaceae bacterium]|nr:protein kinase [Polyangiaceae bacterium]